MKHRSLCWLLAIAIIFIITACASGSDTGLIDGDTDSQSDSDNDDDLTDVDADDGVVLKKQTLHFQLSTNDWLDSDEEYVVHVGGNRHSLKRHTEDSKLQFSELFDSMNEDNHPSHYAEDIPLPTHKATRIHVTQRSDVNGAIKKAHGDGVDHGLSLMFIHIPYESALNHLSKIKSKSKFKDNTGDLTEDALNNYGPDDIAHTIIFHHPELMNINPDHAANVMYNHIYQAAGVQALSQAIQNAGQYGWYDMVPITDSDDQPVMNSRNEIMYKYEIKDEILDSAREAVINSLNSTKNDSSLSGQSYHVTEGVSHIENSGVASKTNGYTFKLGKTGFQHGFRTSMSYDDDKVTLALRNDFVRHLSTFIEFYDENDEVVTPQDWDSFFDSWMDFTGADELETDTCKFLTMVNPVPTIMGIPVSGDFNSSSVTFTWPMNARYAKVRAGGLGSSGAHDTNIVTIGATLTGIFELAIPTVILASTAGMGDESALLESVADDISLAGTVTSFFYSLIWTHSSPTFGTVAKKLAVAAAEFVWTNKTIRNWVIKKIAESELEEAVPFIGLALHIADMASTAATLVETSVEVGTSPWIIENTIQPSHNIDVVISHDVDDFQFPATATHYKVFAKFSGNDTQVIEKTLPVDPTTGDPVTVSEPQTVTFAGVPAGGHFSLKVLFYSDTGWLAAQKDLDGLANVNDDNSDKLTINLAIEENLVPLSADTQYSHKDKLAYNDTDNYHWMGTTDAPTETYLDYSVDTTSNSISYLGNITVSQKVGAAAYTWRGYTPDQDACSGSSSGGQLYNFKSVSLTEDPTVGMMQTECGYSDKPFVLYDFLTAKEDAMNWVVLGKNSEYYVRNIGYETDGTFDVPETSYGKFPIRIDSMVYHPFGYLIGINNDYAKMYSVNLTSIGVTDDLAPEALPIAGPALHLAGIEANPSLLRHPVAIKLSPENTIMVLDDIHELTVGTNNENLKARVKAFTTTGTPVKYFEDKYSLDLIDNDEDVLVTFLDFDFEAQGYIYVLSYATPTDEPNYQVKASDYRLDLYDPAGNFLSRTTGLAAAKMAVDKWRNIFSLNYEMLIGADGYSEPSISEWIPSTPD